MGRGSAGPLDRHCIWSFAISLLTGRSSGVALRTRKGEGPDQRIAGALVLLGIDYSNLALSTGGAEF